MSDAVRYKSIQNRAYALEERDEPLIRQPRGTDERGVGALARGNGEQAAKTDQAGDDDIAEVRANDALLQHIIHARMRDVVHRPRLVAVESPVVPAGEEEGDQGFPGQDVALGVAEHVTQDFDAETDGADEDVEEQPQLAQAGRMSHVVCACWAGTRVSVAMGLGHCRAHLVQGQRRVLLTALEWAPVIASR